MLKKVILLFLFISAFVCSNDVWKLGSQEPLSVLQQQSSADGSTSATLYKSTVPLKYEGETEKQYIRIIRSKKKRWFSNTSEFYSITKIDFIDNDNILIIKNSSTATLSSILNIGNGKEIILDAGAAEYIASGRNKGLILLHDTKGYFREGGAFWVDKLVNKEGDLIEVLSKQNDAGGCVALKRLLSPDNKHLKLRQSLEDCVYIDR